LLPLSEPARFPALACLSGPAGLISPDFTTPPALPVVSIAVMSRRTSFCGMPKSSMFADMPLDNRTVVQFSTVAAIAGFSGCLKRCQVGTIYRNDLKFRRGWQFCNIEPKICQHD
jgi:hypothetical protein